MLDTLLLPLLVLVVLLKYTNYKMASLGAFIVLLIELLYGFKNRGKLSNIMGEKDEVTTQRLDNVPRYNDDVEEYNIVEIEKISSWPF
jgi:hypothetical protein